MMKENMAVKVKKSLLGAAETVLGLIYPHTCPFCGRVVKEEVCPDCAGRIKIIEGPRCMRCSKPVSSEKEEYCYDCSHTHHYYERGYSLWLHNGAVQESVYKFKYHNQRIYGRYYAKELVKHYEASVRSFHIDVIIPIPLFKKRRKERGFNQAEILAREIGAYMELPVDTRYLFRVRSTNPQKKLDPESRRRNLKNAFATNPGTRPPAAVLLGDDIYTTGNTIDSAARALKRAGVQKVYFLTISIGQGY